MFRAALAIALVAVSSTVASAGIYLGLGIGTAVDTGTSNNNTASVPLATAGNGRSTRFMLGERFGHMSIEADIDHYGLLLNDNPYDTYDLAVLVKYGIPIGSGFEVFGKGGLGRTWLTNSGPLGGSPSSPAAFNATGDGWILGAGLEWRLNLILAGCSVFVDYEVNSSSFSNDTSTQRYDAVTGMWMLGATVSL